MRASWDHNIGFVVGNMAVLESVEAAVASAIEAEAFEAVEVVEPVVVAVVVGNEPSWKGRQRTVNSFASASVIIDLD